jgi:hypothetical protein
MRKKVRSRQLLVRGKDSCKYVDRVFSYRNRDLLEVAIRVIDIVISCHKRIYLILIFNGEYESNNKYYYIPTTSL